MVDNINKHANIVLSDDVDLHQLSLEFKLTGAFICKLVFNFGVFFTGDFSLY